MSSPSNEPDFESLRHLLTLKRHEQPPPGYFLHFSDRVIARLEANSTARERSWWQFLVPDLDARPILAGAYGVFVGGVLVVAVWFSQGDDSQPSQGVGTAGQWSAFSPSAVSIQIRPVMATPVAAQVTVDSSEPISSITPVMTPASHLFDPNRIRAEVQQASFGLRQ